MIKEFYKSGDWKERVVRITPAKEQREELEARTDEENRGYWESFVTATIEKVNNLWRLNVCTIWEEETHNMPGFNDLLKDISNAGYHVYCTKSRKPHDVYDQNLYTITLDESPQKEMYGEEMTFEDKKNGE